MFLVTSVAVVAQDCHTTESKPYIYHATKTPYELINNEDSSPVFAAGIHHIFIYDTSLQSGDNSK